MARINLSELIADREAGTEGPWRAHKYCGDEDNWFVRGFADERICGQGSGPVREKNARRIARLPDLEAAYIEAVELLRRFVDVNDEPCWRDHHGYCQAHFLEEECMVADARKFLGDK